MATNGIIWEDPPEASRGAQSKFVEWLTALAEQPGKWARWPETFPKVAPTASVKKVAESIDLKVECVSRQGDKRQRVMWARVVE